MVGYTVKDVPMTNSKDVYHYILATNRCYGCCDAYRSVKLQPNIVDCF